MGRQARLHALPAPHSATTRAIGGPKTRENFSTRILIRCTLNARRMPVPEASPSPIPVPTEHPGRAQETQVLNLSNAEAREWAIPGVHAKGTSGPGPAPRNPAAPVSSAADVPADTWSFNPPAPAADTPATPPANPAAEVPALAEDPQDAVVGLRKAQQAHLTNLTLAALRRARANDPDFPAPAGKHGAELLYCVGDLKQWARNRPRGTAVPDGLTWGTDRTRGEAVARWTSVMATLRPYW